MIDHNFGRIVNVSSTQGQWRDLGAGFMAYRISKLVLNSLTKTVDKEMEGRNILINSVCPGWVRTNMGGSGATRSVDQGIAGIVWAATLPDNGPRGGFYRDGKELDW
jgi:NAD(P)-dependent dehydrogenase (short-subunit alcohol dehydrogenase family)